MATNANWTVVFDDRCIIKNYAEGASQGVGYIIDDDSFWSDSKFSNIWAIQHGTSVTTDEVEYRDETPHTSYADANLGDISQFSSRWDAVHLSELQADWDGNNIDGETEAEKISRIGERPTSYSS
jgi:hypothetical protein|tara:strand:- start:6033 stop:6407 length:375 start_codon:yes stop_codon:yes gene_type:complete